MAKKITANRHAPAKPPARAAAAKLPAGGAARAVRRQGAGAKSADAARIAEIFRRFAAALPLPKGELEFVNPFTLLVAVVLSAQATDSGVNKATKALFPIADTPQKMLALGEDKLREMIRTIGLYRTKAKHVILLSRRLVDDFGGEVPQDRESLEIAAGRRPQDRQCGDEHRLRRADHRRRHAYLPRLEPHSAGARQDAA